MAVGVIMLKQSIKASQIQKVKQIVKKPIKHRKTLASAQSSRFCALKGIRIPVSALKGQCPRPLDDEGLLQQQKV